MYRAPLAAALAIVLMASATPPACAQVQLYPPRLAPILAPSPTVASLYGSYREGQVLTPQIVVGPDSYFGFAHQAFRPFYLEQSVPAELLPFQAWCCMLAPHQVVNGRVRVIHVYIDAGNGGPYRYIGPVESWAPLDSGELLMLSAPYIGRRALQVAP